MKKTLASLILILVAVLTSCGAGLNDWSYELPNEYEVWHINSENINIQRIAKGNNITVIPSFVKEFSYDERYVCTRNISDISKNHIFEEQYYILDTQEHFVYGPYENINEFKVKIEELGLMLDEWYRTSPHPNNVNTDSIVSDVTDK